MINKSEKVTHIRLGDGDIVEQGYADEDNNPMLFLYQTAHPQKPGKRIVEPPEDVDMDEPDVVISFKSIRDIDRFITYLKEVRKFAVEEQKNG